jgi:hypothetical protein
VKVDKLVVSAFLIAGNSKQKNKPNQVGYRVRD